MTGKMPGRVGDSPIIGAGTYADNAAAAVSCTGHGEFFIRYAVSHEIISQMKYKGATVDAAAGDVINRQLKDAGGEGAAIALIRPAGSLRRTTPKGCIAAASRRPAKFACDSTRNEEAQGMLSLGFFVRG